MLRISKLADYGMVIMNYLALQPLEVLSAKDIAKAVQLAQPTVGKLLKMLVKAELVRSIRGSEGGYCLGRPADRITVADVITAIEGKPALTECAAGEHRCNQENVCATRSNWQLVSRVILQALSQLTLADMGKPLNEHPVILYGIKLRKVDSDLDRLQ